MDLGMTRSRLRQEMSSSEFTDWIAAYKIWKQPRPEAPASTPEPTSVDDEVAAFKLEFS